MPPAIVFRTLDELVSHLSLSEKSFLDRLIRHYDYRPKQLSEILSFPTKPSNKDIAERVDMLIQKLRFHKIRYRFILNQRSRLAFYLRTAGVSRVQRWRYVFIWVWKVESRPLMRCIKYDCDSLRRLIQLLQRWESQDLEFTMRDGLHTVDTRFLQHGDRIELRRIESNFRKRRQLVQALIRETSEIG